MSVLRYHWLAAALLTAGAALRIVTQMAYHPALLYIDSLKYLYNAWTGSDPIGYKVPLKLVFMFGGDLGTVTALQHLLGLGCAVALYALLVRRGVYRWLAALAMAPILLDAYQLQAEATIMPDVVFEALIVAALVILLWQPVPSRAALIGAGLILGAAVTVREVGLILIVAAVVYVLAIRGRLLDVLSKSAVICAAFLVPILVYCAASLYTTGHFRLSAKGSAAGRMAVAVDCATIKLPPRVRPLCPTPAEQVNSPDWMEHTAGSPLLQVAPPGTTRAQLVSIFDSAVEHQQPMRVVGSILRDAVRLFALTRKPSLATTPISRWQFQTSYPSYLPEIIPHRNGDIMVGVQVHHSSPFVHELLNPAYGGKAQVDRPLAAFLRSYQLNGGYTPGPLLAIFTVTGLLGSILALIRRKTTPRGRGLALGSLLFFGSAAGLLLVADLYVFSWRYQLPALITLVPAGVLGICAVLDRVRPGTADSPSAASTASTGAPAASTVAPVA